MFKIGDAVRVIPGAAFVDGSKVSNWVFETKLFVRSINDEADEIVVGRRTSGSVTGAFKTVDLVDWTDEPIIPDDFEPYIIRTIEDGTEVFSGPGKRFKKVRDLQKYGFFTVIGEKDGYGNLKIGGWIDLTKVVRK